MDVPLEGVVTDQASTLVTSTSNIKPQSTNKKAKRKGMCSQRVEHSPLLKSNLGGESTSHTGAFDGGTYQPQKTTTAGASGEAVNLDLTMDVGKVANPTDKLAAHQPEQRVVVGDGPTRPAYSFNDLLMMFFELSKARLAWLKVDREIFDGPIHS
ncbi:hypothetical protein PIB30_040935 [Stylosanthes scabra]|uniref:Uncharacterized protein n=1 Tax=Stylosanthes scabra TaxID=79078 RepID=A0ABU6ZDG1_9FABA|nr:hypothetical protein [Stylosanthes scabra]